MQPDAPLLFEDMITRGIEPPPAKPSNISKRIEFKLGDVDAGFAAADEIVEMSFKTEPVHQGYIEPHACIARCDADGQAELWASTPGPLRGARVHRQAARHEDRRSARASRRDRRRLRRQNRHLPRAGGGRAVAQERPPGEDRDEPRRRVQGDRPDLGRVDDRQDRRQEGRHDHRRRRPLQVSGRRLPRLAGDERLHVRLRALRHRRTCARSATTWCATGRSRSPIARRARRSRRSRSRACSTRWRARSAWTRCSCA